MDRGAWVDPAGGKVTVAEWAERWMEMRSDLSPRTRELYEGLLGRHILSLFGTTALSGVTTASVRGWYLSLRAKHESTAEKAYRLLRTMLNTAVADDVIVKNPCNIKGAGVE
ncbi:MAG: hypothetical protein ACRDZQ_15575, partial [Acidimicrobiales bacterium]